MGPCSVGPCSVGPRSVGPRLLGPRSVWTSVCGEELGAVHKKRWGSPKALMYTLSFPRGLVQLSLISGFTYRMSGQESDDNMKTLERRLPTAFWKFSPTKPRRAWGSSSLSWRSFGKVRGRFFGCTHGDISPTMRDCYLVLPNGCGEQTCWAVQREATLYIHIYKYKHIYAQYTHTYIYICIEYDVARHM